MFSHVVGRRERKRKEERNRFSYDFLFISSRKVNRIKFSIKYMFCILKLVDELINNNQPIKETKSCIQVSTKADA